jgi:hypothetical protein
LSIKSAFKGKRGGRRRCRFLNFFFLATVEEQKAKNIHGQEHACEEKRRSRTNIHVVEGNIAHGAPWNFENYIFLNERDIIYKFNNAKQRILFNHFSHFNIKNDKWYSAYKGEWNPETLNQYVYDIYQDYYNKILEIRNKYSIIEEHICPYPNSK